MASPSTNIPLHQGLETWYITKSLILHCKNAPKEVPVLVPTTARGTFVPVLKLREDLVSRKTLELQGKSLNGVLFTLPGTCRLFLILGNYSKNAGSGTG